jgi:hypothetical protein
MDIEGVAKIEELRKSKIRGGEGQLSFLTGSKAGRLGTGGQGRDRCSEGVERKRSGVRQTWGANSCCLNDELCCHLTCAASTCLVKGMVANWMMM